MSMMFNSPQKPFYQSAITMGLSPIPEDTYVQFAIHLFEMFDKQVSPDVIRTVYQKFEGVTWFVQMLMNELFSLTPQGATCEMSQVDVALENIVMSQEAQYKELMSLIPPKQKLVLQAIAREGKANNVTSAQFIRKYQLPSASSIQSAIKGLTEKEILTQEDGCYRIYDYFLAYWIAKVY